MDWATKNGNIWACASILENDLRQECYALTSKDASYCDRITDPDRAQACRDKLAGKTAKPSASATASATATTDTSSADAPPAGTNWSGAFTGKAGSNLSLYLKGDGTLTGTGVVPNALSGGTATLVVEQSSKGTTKWSGKMKATLDGGGVGYDALGSTEWSDKPAWTARVEGNKLKGSVDNLGDFELTRTN
jgi:hypothetical protein